MAETSVADWVTAVGTMLAGLAAVAAVIVGGLTAKAWRAQARAAKEAEVAGEALGAVLQYVSTMRRMTAMYRTTGAMEADVEARWGNIESIEVALKLATSRATAYLPDNALTLLLDVLKAGTTLRWDQWEWAVNMDANTAKPEDHDPIFGAHRREIFQELEKRAIATLRPLARIEHG